MAANGAEQAPVPAPVSTRSQAAALPRIVTDEEIRVRAYFLSLEHGGAGGDIDFWLLAERELRPPTASKD